RALSIEERDKSQITPKMKQSPFMERLRVLPEPCDEDLLPPEQLPVQQPSPVIYNLPGANQPGNSTVALNPPAGQAPLFSSPRPAPRSIMSEPTTAPSYGPVVPRYGPVFPVPSRTPDDSLAAPAQSNGSDRR